MYKNYNISREKLEPEAGFEPRIPVLVQVFLLRSYNVKFPKANKIWVWFQLITWFEV